MKAYEMKAINNDCLSIPYYSLSKLRMFSPFLRQLENSWGKIHNIKLEYKLYYL